MIIARLAAISDRRPHDDDTLHAYIEAVLGYHIPRVAVCPGHQAPFDIIADAFFGRAQRQLVLAGRGTGKTFGASILNLLKSKFCPGTGTGHYAAVEAQSTWGLGYLKEMLQPVYLKKDIKSDLSDYIEWRNGSWVRVGTGRTTAGVTAYHPNRLVIDEVDQWDAQAYETAQYMLSGSSAHPPELQVASTAYTAHGLITPLLAQKERRGFLAYRFCLVPDSLISTEHGQVRIDELCAGDKVWAWNGNEFELRTALQVERTRENAQVVKVQTEDGQSLVCTSDHEVLTQRGWIPARDLTFIDCAQSARGQSKGQAQGQVAQEKPNPPVGFDRNSDPPRGRLGDFVRVVSVSPAGRSDVWDCEVEGLHNFVANGIVVHNCLFEAMQPCPECLGKKCPLYAWENPQTGKYEELCQGRALRSDGFLRYEDVIDEFLRTDSATYQVQKLLEAPERGALIYPRFDPVLHGRSVPEHIRREASVGIGVDWGFDHPEVFSVWAQTGDGRYWGLEEIGRRFLSPSEEMEIAQDLNNKYARAVGTRPNGTSIKAYPTFFCGKDRPQSIRAFAESGLIVVGNEPRLRDDGHKEVRRLLDPNKGPLVAIDPVTMPMTIHELSTMHRDEKGREVLKDNDYGDATRHVLATSALMGGIQAGGGIVR